MSNFPKHFDGKHFFNPGAAPARGLKDVLRWKLTTRPHPSPRFVDDVQPSVPPGRMVPDSPVRVTLINHSTVLLQWNGMNILTDPIWSKRASPLSWIGPKRRRAPGVKQADLPTIDVVLLSHNHYDHLDLPSLRWLAGRDRGAKWIVPLGVAKLMRKQNIGPVDELDWGNDVQVGPLSIDAVPAMHFSARSTRDRNQTLWCGYMLRMAGQSIYYAGDTAFGPHFQSIRDQYGVPDISLLPIGAYLPRWFMSAVHMGPEEALQAHTILGSPVSVAVHHGTFQLADDALDEAGQTLKADGGQASISVLRNGESIEVGP